MWHNIIEKDINLNFDKFNNDVPHHFKIFFFYKIFYKSNILKSQSHE